MNTHRPPQTLPILRWAMVLFAGILSFAWLIPIPLPQWLPFWIGAMTLLLGLYFGLTLRQRPWLHQPPAFRNLVYVTLLILIVLIVVSVWVILFS